MRSYLGGRLGLGLATGLSLVGAIVSAVPATGAPSALGTISGRYLPSAGASSVAQAISASGVVAGSVGGAPAVWPGGRLHPLPYPAGAVPAGATSVFGQATAIEGATVAGDVSFQPSPGVSNGAVLVWRSGRPSLLQGSGYTQVVDLNAAGTALVSTGLPRLGQTYTVQSADGSVVTVPFPASALDSAGRVAGLRYDIGPGVFDAKAVRFDHGTTTELSTPAGVSSAVNDVAPDGTMCGETFTLGVGTGTSAIRTDRHAALWRSDGTLLALSAPGTQSWCTRVASDRVAAGQFIAADGSTQSVVWQSGQASPVGPANVGSLVTGVNRAGQVIGTATSSTGQVGFVARAQGWYRLVALGASQNYPRAINDAGTVAGTVNAADGTQRAVVWQTAG